MGPSNISFADFKNKGSREKIKDGKNNSGGEAEIWNHE